MNIRLCFTTGLVILLVSAAGLFAGGSGLNVVVVVNQNSTNSIQLGNYYCERRGVPPQNLLRINWDWTKIWGNVSWNQSNFQTNLLNPLVAMLASRSLTNQVDYVVLSMDIPYRVAANNGKNATTAALFYGFKPDDSIVAPDRQFQRLCRQRGNFSPDTADCRRQQLVAGDHDHVQQSGAGEGDH
jgi:uncharacterized protein (TIGR03790 family)